jgi:hypothetical protein
LFFIGYFVFLVLEEENAALIHHLLRVFEDDCFFASATAANFRLVVAENTSRYQKTENLFEYC